MSQPIVPPRPQQRTQAIAEGQNAAQLPQIPPRPVGKHLERSISPANYPRSPLNEPHGFARKLSVDRIPRPPSVSRLPMSGEEGMEYGEVQFQPQILSNALGAEAAEQTRQVSDDLPMHAPKPSLPQKSATAQVQAVTRTDSSTTAAHGIVRPPSQEPEQPGRTRSRASFSRPDSAASGDRRRSVYALEHDHGPAEIGIRVPINPLLGDVQAPSPAPGLSPHHTGNSPLDSRKRQLSKAGRDVYLPPGSYGLHGHGVVPADKFEKDWYAKHPEQLEHEEGHGHGVYESAGSGRGTFALSSDDLNKIVSRTASRGHGFGTSANVVSYPDEQIGYMASEQYQSRQQTPSQTPLQTPLLQKTHSISEPFLQSPLRKASGSDGVSGGTGRRSSGEDKDVDEVHIGAPAQKYNKITGGQGSIQERENVKPYVSHSVPGGEDGDHGYTVPILAEDEVAKGVGFEHLQPAVSPANPRRLSGWDDHGESTSRPSSRPGSIYNLHSASNSLSRFHSRHEDEREHMHTPLEDVDEYEPLFPEDDGKAKALSATERFKKRPDSLRHKFPSQDIWEDTPSSAMIETTVSTPDLPRVERFENKESSKGNASGLFETPEAEAIRKGEPSEAEKKKLIPAEERLARSKFAPHLRDDMPTRPGMQPRFPSQDIWEDSPDSQALYTTVGEPEAEDKPVVPQRPAKSRLGEGASSAQVAPSVEPEIPSQSQKMVHAVPPIDARLTDLSAPKEPSPTELRKVPSIPDRPKPQIPSRPAKKQDDNTLSKTISTGSTESAETVTGPPVTKTKPQIPARPQGSKIANLRSNFMNDLNAKLGMGPPKEKEPEPVAEPEDVKPLEDARKGRARGPQRRAPAKSPSASAQPLSFSISQPKSLWHIDDHGSLNMSVAKANAEMTEKKLEQIEHSTPADAPLPVTIDTTSKIDHEAIKQSEDVPAKVAPSLAANTAGESVDPIPSALEENPTMSKQSTLSDVSGATLEQYGTREPTSISKIQSAIGDDAPKEPMPEKDINYHKLEEMTAAADGKAHASEEGTSV